MKLSVRYGMFPAPAAAALQALSVPVVRPAAGACPLRFVDCIVPRLLWALMVKCSHQAVGLRICPTTQEALKD